MARHESDREDLFAELAALSPRIELLGHAAGQTVCAGRRESTGGWSIYLGPDQVYHFDAAGQLRRAYVQGVLYRSEGGTLSQLRRERTPAETSLLRRDLNPDELHQLLETMRAAIATLRDDLQENRLPVQRVSPDSSDVPRALRAALTAILSADPPLAPPLRS